MKRPISQSAWVVVATFLALPAAAVTNFEVSGGTTIVIIDADGDGPDADDCILTATFADPGVEFSKTQNNSPKIKGCDGGSTLASLFLGQDSSSDFLTLEMASTSEPTGATSPLPQLATLFRIPFTLDAYEEFVDGAPDGFPAAINTVDFMDGVGRRLATGYLCDAGGPTVLIDFFGLASLSIPLGFYPNAAAPTHVTIPNAPYERAAPNLGSFTFADVHIPLQDGAIRLGLAGESPLLVDLPLDDLQACRSVSSAPAVSTWAGAFLAAGLLLVGVRHQRRRRGGSPR